MMKDLRSRTELWTPPRLISENERGQRLTRRADAMVPMMEKWTKSKEYREQSSFWPTEFFLQLG